MALRQFETMLRDGDATARNARRVARISDDDIPQFVN